MLSYRDVEELLAERHVTVDHGAIMGRGVPLRDLLLRWGAAEQARQAFQISVAHVGHRAGTTGQ